jgi:hypothetical protein
LYFYACLALVPSGNEIELRNQIHHPW